MAKKKCGGPIRSARKTVPVKAYKRSTPGPTCHGKPKPGPKNVNVKPHKRSRP